MAHRDGCECYTCRRARRLAAGRCPSCPARLDEPHKFSCAYAHDRLALPVVEVNGRLRVKMGGGDGPA